MYAITDDLVRTLMEERIARNIHAQRAARLRARRSCPLERLARWIAWRRQTKLDPALLAR
jgi:hypothetical protein